MADRKPPRLVSDERATLLALLQYQRESLIRKVEGVEEQAARTSPVASGTSLLWLVQHLAHAEALWIAHRFAGEDISPPNDLPQSDDTLATALDAYRATWVRVDAIVASAPNLDLECATTDGESAVNLRWVLMHLLEETARHAGHADILRELIDGQIGR
jgi:uncharacterized damage-inducible protein DinB